MNHVTLGSDSRFDGDAIELQEGFAFADLDGDGRLSYTEFKTLLDGLDSGMSEEEMRTGFAAIDTDGDRCIDSAEFIAWWTGD